MDIQQVMAGRVKETQVLNQASPIKAESLGFTSRPVGFFQYLTLGVLGVVTAFFTGYGYERYLTVGLTFWFPLIAFLFFCACSILHVFLAKKVSSRLLFMVLEVVALFGSFLAFIMAQDSFALILIVVLFLFFLWGYMESRAEVNYGSEIRFFRMTRSLAAKLVTAMLLFGIFFFIALRGGVGNFFVSESTFNGFFTGAAVIFNDFYPNTPLDGSFADFTANVARGQLQNDPKFSALSASAQSTVIDQSSASLMNNFSLALGVPITPSSTTSNVLYRYVVTSFNNWYNRFGSLFILGWALAVFIVLRSIGVLFILFAQFFAMIFYEILLAMGVIRLTEHPQTKESVEFTW